ncbi:hypothetical protein IFM89_013418 [Coptis chinensis]|uniref:peptidylprolyl isomerase n=1 Tax=Coptis chinensis TaxID=261450 RepID=A0A835LIH7_9MAGN|nr:hypothetical protein IFM89_013418 [Coptis chinensis]
MSRRVVSTLMLLSRQWENRFGLCWWWRTVICGSATIGFSTNLQKSIVQCNVGDKSPVLLCRLIPDRTECCVLALEFEEEDEVVFSVIGSRSVHLTGYYLGRGSAHIHDNDEDYDLHGRDLNENDSERSSEQEEESDDDFIDDGELEIFPPSPAPKSKVVIEDILEDERPANTNVFRKRLRRKYHVSDSESNDDVKIVHKAVTSAKKKIEGVRTCETEREVEQPNASSLPYLEIGHENTEKRKKKKKKRAREGKTGGVKHDENNNISQVEPVRDKVNEKPFAHKTVNESAEVKEKFNKKVVKASKKKDKDEFDQVTDAKSKSVDVGGDEVERTEDVSAEVKVKSDETVAMEVAKKAEDEDDLLVSSQTKTRGQSTVLEEKSDEKVVIETKKKAEDEDDLSVASLTKTHGLNAEVEEKSVEKVVIETKKKAEDEDYLPVASLTKTHGLNAEVEEKSDEKIVIETKNAEHDDDFPISFLSKTQAPSAEAEEKSGETVVVEIKKNAEDAGVLVTSAKRKIEEVQHCETEREVEQLNGFSLPSLELGHETKDKQKKPKKKERAKEGKSGGVGDDKANDISQESIRDEVNEKHITHKTQNGSEVKEKSDMKVVESCKKKDKDGIDLENEDKNDLRISSLSMAKGQSSEVEDKSDKNVVMESKKKAEAGDALPVKEVQDF